MDRYIGLDAHASSCTLAVVGPSGRRLQSQVLETNAKALIDCLRSIPQPRHLGLEEGNHANWLYEVLAPHVQEIVVAGISQSRGPKSDKTDAFALAERLRIGAIETRVYKPKSTLALLGELSRAYTILVGDSVRVQNRIKSLYRSRGVAISTGREVYSRTSREAWLPKLPERTRPLAQMLYQEYDALNDLRRQAQKALLAEAGQHAIARTLQSCPGMGPIRIAQMLPIVVTPYRFANKRAFWAYCGLAIVMRSSSDWVRTREGTWARAPVQLTRGLNHNCNRTLKRIFKGAATTIIGRKEEDEPLYRHYQQLLDAGTKPNLAKLTLARQIASIILSLWRSEEVYDPAKLKPIT
jgi:transposase